MSDQYWICPAGAKLTWDDINFFHNDFSEDIGDILFGEGKKADDLNLSSPNNTSDGNLKKRWKIINGKRCLIKGGSNPFRQQPFNEVIASGIMERLGIHDVVHFLDRMLVLDYIIANEDRHLNNFGALRNIETLEWIGMASIYDSGSSLGYDKIPA